MDNLLNAIKMIMQKKLTNFGDWKHFDMPRRMRRHLKHSMETGIDVNYMKILQLIEFSTVTKNEVWSTI